MKIIDNHLHIGNFSDTERVTPEQVKEDLARFGVTGGLVMPFAMRGGGDNWAVHEQLYRTALDSGFDIALYVNTDMLQLSEDLSLYLHFPFKALKIHPDAITFSDYDIHRICEIASTLKLPVMIHTGADDCCRSGRFEQFIQQYRNLKFVLCHARPAEEAFQMLKHFENVWIDTAFLSFVDLKSNLSPEIWDRILFGTDFPANRWFPHLGDETKWYQRQITSIIKTFPSEVAEKMLYKNYNRIFTNK